MTSTRHSANHSPNGPDQAWRTPSKTRQRVPLTTALIVFFWTSGCHHIPVGEALLTSPPQTTELLSPTYDDPSQKSALLMLLAERSFTLANSATLRHHVTSDLNENHAGADEDQSAWKTLLQFETPPLPKRAFVDSAVLVLTEGSRVDEGSGKLRVKAVNTPWAVETLSWETQPGVDVALVSEARRGNGVARVNVTAMVRRWVTGQLPNHGLMVESATPSAHFWSTFMAANADTLRAPRLEIYYTYEGGAPQ